MKYFGFLIVVSLISIFSISNAQIVIGNENDNLKNTKKVKPSRIQDGKTSVFFLANISQTSRTLIENKQPFGDSLGFRADENALNKWSFGIGLRNQLNGRLFWEGGISLLRNGERYDYNAIDSAFSYKTSYSYIGMPVKLSFQYGKKISLFANAGLIPQIYFDYKKEERWKTTEGNEDVQTINVKEGYPPNSFALSALFNIGISIKMQEKWSLFIMPEYRVQLNSTYNEYDKYIHKAKAIGLSFGLYRNL
jgi:hypothetical protein